MFPLIWVNIFSEEGLLFIVMKFCFHLPTFYTEILPYIVPLYQTRTGNSVKVYGKKLCLKIWHIAELYPIARKRVIKFLLPVPIYWYVSACKRLRHWKLSAFYIFIVVMLKETLLSLFIILTFCPNKGHFGTDESLWINQFIWQILEPHNVKTKW